jgi:putative ABC transport system ATP-binding protein
MSNGASEVYRIEHLSKDYPDGQVHALTDVSLAVRRGEYVAIMGPSGCGKSTLLNLLGALDLPSVGDIWFEGESLSTMPDRDAFRARKVGFVFQAFLLLPTLTAAENVQVPMFEGPLPAGERAKKACELLAEVGMGHRLDHLPTKLSAGERQRVAVARALANDPVALLADEPTGNLDTRTAGEVLELFDRLHRERGLTLVVVTHSEDLARRAQRVVRLQDGKIISDTSNPRN